MVCSDPSAFAPFGPWIPLAQLACVPWHCLISNRFYKGGSSPVSWMWHRHPLGALEETGMEGQEN